MKTKIHSGYLPILPALKSGHIAHGTARPDGTIAVYFEHPAIVFETTSLAGVNERSQMLFTGIAEQLDAAMIIALRSYYKSRNMLDRHTASTIRPSFVDELVINLESWLLNHRGSFQAVCDVDGVVLVRLTGLSNPSDQYSSHVTLEGSGRTFYSALSAATAKYGKVTPDHQQISIKAD